MKFSKASIALLVIQLAIVSTVAAKYLYQRSACPRVWTRANAYDPSLVMRGRYLSLQLTVDGCSSTLPSAKDAQFPRNMSGVPAGNTFSVRAANTVSFQAKLAVKDNKLIAIRVPESELHRERRRSLAVPARHATRCDSRSPSISTSLNMRPIPRALRLAMNCGSK